MQVCNGIISWFLGHYHYDVTPEEVEYEGYFVVCDEVFRVAKATPSPDRTVFFK